MENQTENKRPTELSPEQKAAAMMQQLLKDIVGSAIAMGPQAGMQALANVINREQQAAYQAGLEARHIQSRKGEIILKNQKNGAEMLRITMDGKIYVDGEEAETSEMIGIAVMDWQKVAMAEAKKSEEKPAMKATKGGKKK